MSQLSEKEIAIKIRRRMNAPVSDRLRYAPLIDDGLLLLSRDAAKDKDRRQNFITDRATTALTLDTAGVGDLTDLITTQRILVDCLKYGEMVHSSNPNPLVERQQGSRPGNYDRMYLHYVLDGHKVRTVSSNNNATPLTVELKCALVRWVTLAQLAEEEVERLVEKCVELLIENHRDYEQEGDDEQ
jgi:hypothetical protein